MHSEAEEKLGYDGIHNSTIQVKNCECCAMVCDGQLQLFINSDFYLVKLLFKVGANRKKLKHEPKFDFGLFIRSTLLFRYSLRWVVHLIVVKKFVIANSFSSWTAALKVSYELGWVEEFKLWPR